VINENEVTHYFRGIFCFLFSVTLTFTAVVLVIFVLPVPDLLYIVWFIVLTVLSSVLLFII